MYSDRVGVIEHMVNRLCPSQVTERHSLSNKSRLTSNKGAYTRPNPTRLFERREKRRMRHHSTKHRKEFVTNNTEYVNI